MPPPDPAQSLPVPDEPAGPPSVVYVGPVAPLRGGIAQHGTSLVQALADVTPVSVLSFAHLYPAWLYPGASQRDARLETLSACPVSFRLRYDRPWRWAPELRRTVEAARLQAPDREPVLVVALWTVVWMPGAIVMVRTARRLGVRSIVMVHNAVDHEAAAWIQAVARAALRRADAAITHGRAVADQVRALAPDLPIAIHPHPAYDRFPTPTTTLPRRAGLELLFFGFVRPYKGLDTLIAALARVRRRDWHLSIVGEFWSPVAETHRRIAAAGLCDRITVVDRYVDDAEAAAHFTRADLMILPYHTATGSGVMAMAIHFGLPAIATGVGALSDLIVEGETGYVVPPRDSEALAAIIDAVDPPTLRAMRPAVLRLSRTLSWSGLAQTVLSLAATVRPPSPQGGATVLHGEPEQSG